MKEKLINQKGITMVVLATIIVIMAILISVAVNIIIDSNLLENSKDAVEGYNNKLSEQQNSADYWTGIAEQEAQNNL